MPITAFLGACRVLSYISTQPILLKLPKHLFSSCLLAILQQFLKLINRLIDISSPVEEITYIFLFVALVGFEPTMTESKSVVLPLHHRA